jgi:hypothetical protein
MSVIQYAIDYTISDQDRGRYTVRGNQIAENYFKTYPRFLKAIIRYDSLEECLKHLNFNDRRIVMIICGDEYESIRNFFIRNINRLSRERIEQSNESLWNLREALDYFVPNERLSNFSRRVNGGKRLVDNELVMNKIFDSV